MVNLDNSQDINFLSKIFNSDIINALMTSSIYKKIQFVFLAIFLVYFLFWIFLNIYSKVYKRSSKNYVIKNMLLIFLPYLSFIPRIIEYHVKIFKKEYDKSYYVDSILNDARSTLLFQIVDLLSIIFIFTLVYYQYKNMRKYFHFKNLSFQMKSLLIFKIVLYLIELFIIKYYYKINSRSEPFYLDIYWKLNMINDALSRILITSSIINNLEECLNNELKLFNVSEDSPHRKPMDKQTLIDLENHLNNCNNNEYHLYEEYKVIYQKN